jgi:hypothetical protein
MRRILLIASAIVVAGATTTAIVASDASGSRPKATEECVKSCQDHKSECSRYMSKHSCSDKHENKSESPSMK